MTPTHPLGLIDNPEWEAVEHRRQALYLARREELYAKPRRRFGPVSFAIAMVVLVAIAAVIGWLL